MTQTNDELATKIVYLKANNFMPNIDNESLDIQNMIRSYYYRKSKDINYWFKLAFCNYEVTDKFVHEVNLEYKRFLIKNIAKDEM